ncbi:hypothetical protein ACIPY6_13750 [Streptomyces sp. NPDC090054]|uniref:hypothetical protein n=1 Tax=Streptomyces sp. NPDC090054 TaxID=3365933 RepID=UPI003813E3C2
MVCEHLHGHRRPVRQSVVGGHGCDPGLLEQHRAARTRDEGLAAAREAFTSAMSVTFLVGVCGALGAAVLALFLMQNRATEVAAKEAARTQDQFATVAGP